MAAPPVRATGGKSHQPRELLNLFAELEALKKQNALLEANNSNLRQRSSELEQRLLELRVKMGQLPTGEAAQLARETAAMNYARACLNAIEVARIEDANLSLENLHGKSCSALLGAVAARFTTIRDGEISVDNSVLDGYRLTITQKDGKVFDYVNRELKARK